MKAWKRTIVGISGIIIALGFSITGTGCSAPIAAELSIEAHYELKYRSTYDFPSKYDLDTGYKIVEYGEKKYKYYLEQQCLYDPLTSRLYRLDDQIVQTVMDSLPTTFVKDNFSEINYNDESTMQIIGEFSPIAASRASVLDSKIEFTLWLNGTLPIPAFDCERWPSLDRQIFVFPDGLVGSPDTMTLILTGELCDVFGYMAELGVVEGNSIIDGNECSLFIDDEGQWADLFINDVLLCSILLN